MLRTLARGFSTAAGPASAAPVAAATAAGTAAATPAAGKPKVNRFGKPVGQSVSVQMLQLLQAHGAMTRPALYEALCDHEHAEALKVQVHSNSQAMLQRGRLALQVVKEGTRQRRVYKYAITPMGREYLAYKLENKLPQSVPSKAAQAVHARNRNIHGQRVNAANARKEAAAAAAGTADGDVAALSGVETVVAQAAQ